MQPQKPYSTIPNTSKNNLNLSGIGYSKPIGEPRQPGELYQIVDLLLEDYKDLIDQRYKQWFAKRFYTLPFDLIHSAASEARHAKQPQQLFVFIIKKKYNAMTTTKRYQDLRAASSTE